jgi:hypothetical protein
MSNVTTKTIASSKEIETRQKFFDNFKGNPIPDNEKLANVALFLKRQELTKIVYLNELYKQITTVHGVIMEFGVRWGQNMVTLSNLRGIYEPYNYSRKIVGFDTFAGFDSISDKDGQHEIIKDGNFATTDGYEKYLEEILTYHQSESPLSHINKFELMKGNAIHEVEKYLKAHPETIIAFAYFDFDIYEPTARCLEAIIPYMAKGGIIAFDELVDPHFPGETVAFREVLANKFRIKRMPFCGIQSYMIYE